jgi:hypothetical protein
MYLAYTVSTNDERLPCRTVHTIFVLYRHCDVCALQNINLNAHGRRTLIRLICYRLQEKCEIDDVIDVNK